MHDHSPSLGNGGIISLWEEREGKKEGKGTRGGEGKGKRGEEKEEREYVTNSEILIDM